MPRQYKLKWVNLPPDNLAEIEEKIFSELDQMGDSIAGNDPSQLLFHTVFLGETMFTGPIIDVWGEEGDSENYYCDYREKIDWISLKDL